MKKSQPFQLDQRLDTAVNCPFCHVLAGQWCVLPGGGRPSGVHRARRQSAMRCLPAFAVVAGVTHVAPVCGCRDCRNAHD